MMKVNLEQFLVRTIESGEKVVPEETVLEFEVSKGPEKIILKDLTQYNLKGAQDYASFSRADLDASEEKYDDKIPAGMVISQSPAAWNRDEQRVIRLPWLFQKGKKKNHQKR